MLNSPGFAPAGGCFVDLSAGKISLKITFSSESHSLPPTLHASPLLQSKFSCHLNVKYFATTTKVGEKDNASLSNIPSSASLSSFPLLLKSN